MNLHKIGCFALIIFSLRLVAAEEPVQSKAKFQNREDKPASVYATVLPKFSYLKFLSTQADGEAGATFVSNTNMGTEFSWGLTNERLHFLLFGEVLKVSLIPPPSTAAAPKTLTDKDVTLAKGGFGIGLHPTRSKDFFGLLFCSFDQEVFITGDSVDTSKINISRLTIPHAGLKLAFTTFRWKFLSLGAEINAALAFSSRNDTQSINWGYNTFGKIILGIEATDKITVEVDPEFSFSKYYTHVVTQSRTGVGAALGVRVALD